MAYPTNPIYKLIKNRMTGLVDQVSIETDNIKKIIPFVDDNIDYQEYLEWAKTNTAEEAD
tara:strand:+ start:1002 stop:1181 length:180 start_codon:yes stop_codon:yes gene_type:complete